MGLLFLCLIFHDVPFRLLVVAGRVAFMSGMRSRTASTRPYSSISFSSSHLLRSQSLAMRSKGWPVALA